MTIGIYVAGYLLTVLVAVFVFAYADRTCDCGVQTDDCACVVLALIWPVVLLILLGWSVIDLPIRLADRYARKHKLKKKEAQS